MVAVPPAGTVPVQVRFGAAYDTDPAVAAASPLYAASSSTPASGSVNVAPSYAVARSW